MAFQRTPLMDHPYQRPGPPPLNYVRTSLTSNIYWLQWNPTTGTERSWLHDVEEIMRPVTEHPLWEDFDRFRQGNAQFSVLGYELRHFSREDEQLEYDWFEDPKRATEDDALNLESTTSSSGEVSNT